MASCNVVMRVTTGPGSDWSPKCTNIDLSGRLHLSLILEHSVQKWIIRNIKTTPMQLLWHENWSVCDREKKEKYKIREVLRPVNMTIYSFTCILLTVYRLLLQLYLTMCEAPVICRKNKMCRPDYKLKESNEE